MDLPAADPLAQQRRNARGLATREALLEATLRVVAAQGYSGSGVLEIGQAAGLSKNHIFQHFGSKERLALAALERALAVWRGDVALAAQIFPQPERQLAHAAQSLATLTERGWPGLACLATLAQHRAALPAELGTAVDAALEEMGDFFRDALKEARRSGTLRLDAKPRQLGQFCVSALLGSCATGADPAGALVMLRGLLLGVAG